MYKTYLIILSAILITSCYKKLEVDNPSFEVAIDPYKNTIVADTFVFKLGDTTRFIFEGTADNIIFYSGESGKRYDFRNRANVLGNATLNFSSKKESSSQNNTLQILATNKLANLDSATVVNAAWTDITNRANLATNATVVASGAIRLNDLVSSSTDSLFLAFKYTGLTGTTQPTWTITSYTVNNAQPPIWGVADVTYNIGAIGTDNNYWKSYGNIWSPANAKWVPTTSALTINGGNDIARPNNTAWLVSKPLYIGRVPPDISSATVKTVNAIMPILTDLRPGYAYKYSAVGLYKASWVYFNYSTKEEKGSVKEFYIRIVP